MPVPRKTMLYHRESMMPVSDSWLESQSGNLPRREQPAVVDELLWCRALLRWITCVDGDHYYQYSKVHGGNVIDLIRADAKALLAGEPMPTALLAPGVKP